VFICSIMLLFVTILLLTGSIPFKVIVFVLLVEIFSPNLMVTDSSWCIEICSTSSGSATATWSSVNKIVLMSSFLEVLIPFVSSYFHYVIILFIYVLNKVGEREQPCRTPLLIFISCVNVAFSFIFISCCFHIFL